MINHSDFQAHAADWRTQIRKNEFRTKMVIIFFILIYLVLGFIIDLFIYSNNAIQSASLSLQQTALQLLTFQIIPVTTLIMSAVAMVSLLITYAFHDRIIMLGTQYKEITVDATQQVEKQLYNVVEEMKVAAGLTFMPRIFIIEADYMNAFASGYSEKSALVAITRGLLNKLTRSELQAVMAHELSHIRHHDIKLTLAASILTNLMLIAIDILFYSMLYGRNRKNDNRFFIIIFLLRYLLPLITLLLMLYLSRTREYMADAGCIELMRENQPLASALMKIHQDYVVNSSQYHQQLATTAHEEVRQAAYLYDPKQAGIAIQSGFSSLFSTHPTLEQRLSAIGFNNKQT